MGENVVQTKLKRSEGEGMGSKASTCASEDEGQIERSQV